MESQEKILSQFVKQSAGPLVSLSKLVKPKTLGSAWQAAKNRPFIAAPVGLGLTAAAASQVPAVNRHLPSRPTKEDIGNLFKDQAPGASPIEERFSDVASAAVSGGSPTPEEPATVIDEAKAKLQENYDAAKDAVKEPMNWLGNNWKPLAAGAAGGLGLYGLYELSKALRKEKDDEERWASLPKLAAEKPKEFAANYPNLTQIIIAASEAGEGLFDLANTVKQASVDDVRVLNEYVTFMTKEAQTPTPPENPFMPENNKPSGSAAGGAAKNPN